MNIATPTAAIYAEAIFIRLFCRLAFTFFRPRHLFCAAAMPITLSGFHAEFSPRQMIFR